jgi:hypothetical protein
MICPHCQQENQSFTSDGQRAYYRCTRCQAVYSGLPAAPPPVTLPGRQPPAPIPTPFNCMAPARRRAIRALLRRVKAQD